MLKSTISISISKELLQKIDLKKGLATRSAYIEYILKSRMEEEDVQ